MLLNTLQQTFGYTQFRPGQKEAAESLCNGQDTIVIMPTGGGKSLCYQLPGVIEADRETGLALVVSPLISLMEDQVQSLKSKGVAAGCLHSNQSETQWRERIQQIYRGELSMLYVSPERVAAASFRKVLKEIPLSFAVIDEAHCISQWGHDFRKDYRKLTYLKNTLGLPVMAVTATATPSVLEDIQARLKMKDPLLIRGSFRRENLRFSLEYLRKDEQRMERTIQLLKEREMEKMGKGRALIYCATRKKVTSVAEQLKEAGFPAGAYHAGMTALQRQKAHQAYDEGKKPILVATNAFGMGIDHPNVRMVIHFQMPGSLDAYYQEAGRAGRDGQEAHCVALYGDADRVTQRMLARKQKGAKADVIDHKMEQIEKVTAYAHMASCRQVFLAQHFQSPHENDHQNCGCCDACTRPEEVEKQVAQKREQQASERAKKARLASHEILPAESALILGLIQHMPRPSSKKVVAMALRGSRAKEVRRRRLVDLPQHGSLRHVPQAAIERRIDELLAEGVVVRKGVKYPTVWPEGKPVRAPSIPGKSKKKRTLGSPLKDALAEYRKKTARKLRWKSYMVFTNAVISELDAQLPGDIFELASIPGLGQKRIDRFGADILDILDRYREDSDQTSTMI